MVSLIGVKKVDSTNVRGFEGITYMLYLMNKKFSMVKPLIKTYNGGAVYEKIINERITIVTRVDVAELESGSANVYAYIDDRYKEVHVVQNITNRPQISKLLKKWATSKTKKDYSVVLYDYKENWIDLVESVYHLTGGKN